MSQIDTKIMTTDDRFRENVKHMRALVEDLRSVVDKVCEGGGAARQARHVERGKLLARDRIRALIDPGSAFLELSQLAALDVYETEVPAAGIITGVGVIHGRECMIIANDATVKGGS